MQKARDKINHTDSIAPELRFACSCDSRFSKTWGSRQPNGVWQRRRLGRGSPCPGTSNSQFASLTSAQIPLSLRNLRMSLPASAFDQNESLRTVVFTVRPSIVKDRLAVVSLVNDNETVPATRVLTAPGLKGLVPNHGPARPRTGWL